MKVGSSWLRGRRSLRGSSRAVGVGGACHAVPCYRCGRPKRPGLRLVRCPDVRLLRDADRLGDRASPTPSGPSSGRTGSSGREKNLVRYARYEAAAEAGPYLRYRDVLAAGLRGVAGEFGFEPTAIEVADFAGSVRRVAGIRGLGCGACAAGDPVPSRRDTNCDDDLFAASNRRLGVTFDWIVTAEQVGSYKPTEPASTSRSNGWACPGSGSLHVSPEPVPRPRPGEAPRLVLGLDRSTTRPGGRGCDAPRRLIPPPDASSRT